MEQRFEVITTTNEQFIKDLLSLGWKIVMMQPFGFSKTGHDTWSRSDGRLAIVLERPKVPV